MTSGYEYVYYWKDMFAEAGVSVPTTWDEFIEAGIALQNYYGASLGLGHDQVLSMFSAKKAAMIACGDWALQTMEKDAEDLSDLGTFYLPARDTEEDPYNVIVQGDSFMGVTTHSKHPEAAVAFIEWFYSEEFYPEYINYISSASSMTNFPKEKAAVLAEADENCPDKVLIMYDGGGDDFTAIQNNITFDYKKLGAQMLTEGFDLDATFTELNEKWKSAREKLGIR